MTEESDDSVVPAHTMNRYGGTESLTINRLEYLLVQSEHASDWDEGRESSFILDHFNELEQTRRLTRKMLAVAAKIITAWIQPGAYDCGSSPFTAP